MAFVKGKSGNLNGRPKGSIDKAKKDIKESFQQIIECNILNIEKWFNDVALENPAKALELMLRFSEYVIPKIRSVEGKTDVIESKNDNSLHEAIARISYRSEEEIRNSNEYLAQITEKILAQKSNTDFNNRSYMSR